MNKKEQMKKALEVIKEGLIQSGETEFAELKKREKKAILSQVSELLPFDCDGDKDASYRAYPSHDPYEVLEYGGVQIVFSAPTCDYDDFEDYVDSVWVEIDEIPYQSDNTLDIVNKALDHLSDDVKVVNLTPHDVNIVNDNGEVIRTYPATGTVARVASSASKVREIDGVDVVSTEFGDVDGLPPQSSDTVYIVSMLVAQALSDRTDLIAPDTGPQSVVRDDKGQIIGVKRFARY